MRKRRAKRYKVSRAEKQILSLLQEHDYEVMAQFRIAGIPYIFDFYFPKLNLILEFQGSYWHCDPKQYKSGSLIKMVGYKEKIIVDYIWWKDELKARSAQSQGDDITYLWEQDFKTAGWSAVEKSIKSFVATRSI